MSNEDKEFKLTPEERKAIKSLNSLAKQWPKSLWLFSGAGTLHVMRYDSTGDVAVTNSGGMDQRYIVETVLGIPNDGGDW